jgi:hypothetical protein
MTGDPSTDERPRAEDEELSALLGDPDVRAWFNEHLPELRRSASGNRLLYQSLGVAFAIGLAAHIGGYLLKTSGLSEPWALIADLLYALGWALWTGVVMTLFVQVIPEIKRRQFRQALAAYEAARRMGPTPDAGPASGARTDERTNER